ncbi:AAA family ATPase [Candidatus Paracaedibacter symbiosus]|uniref:AAA family ATPase n=1 Tax=Candidatus Paracaedibacter symbiosus TaxID=244582 RepID=UPI0006893FDD|nr:AAA family ATPase [Candidatus Paracaedibacter symbiosus]
MIPLDTTLPPRLQKQLLGHEGQWQLLQRQFSENKLHPAWLLVGQKGIGKATFAYQTARTLLKADQGNDQFFDTLIDQKSHPNLLIIEKELDEDGKPANDITVEGIRKIADFVHQSAAFPGWRVIIIDAIEELNRNAANALLKILEEPPKQVLILLVCHSVGRILPTIRSRCCLLSFDILTQEVLTEVLGKVPDPLAYALANGSIGQLLELEKFALNDLLEEVINVLQAVMANRLTSLQQFVGGFEKGDPLAQIMLILLPWISCQLVLLKSQQNSFVLRHDTLLPLANLRIPSHWLLVQEKLSLLLQNAKDAHLDFATLLTAAFLCFESPHLMKEFT